MTTGGTWLGRTTLLARPARLLLICLALFVGSADVQAGDISTRRTDRCDVQFSGDIEDGDAAKLVAALKAVDTSSAPAKIARLCLDSPGGSFAEAVTFLKKTLTRVSYASVIEPLAECNSACALIFLGAHLNSGDGYFEAYRLLDVSGQLGFHAPYVAPSETQIVDPAIVSRSYREGVEAVADLLDLNPILFPRSLLAEFLRVGPDQFLKIDEVGQLAAWNIGLTGYRRPTAITEKQMEHACTNQRMRSDPQIYSVVSSFEPEPELASDPIPLSEKMVVRSEHLVEGVAGCTVRARLYGDFLFLLADTTSDEAGEAPAQNDGEGDILTSKISILASPVDPDSYTPAYFLFGPRTKVRTLKGA
jgi:hypothetical protein